MKRKLPVVVLCVLMALMCVFALSACDISSSGPSHTCAFDQEVEQPYIV